MGDPPQRGLLLTCLASGSAGLVGRALCHPIDTLKARMQIGDAPSTLRGMIRSTWKLEGLAGFYRGIVAVSVGGVPGVCIYITTYEKSKALLQGKVALFRDRPFASYLLSGMAAEAACCALFIPVDVVKERLQVQAVSNQAYRYSGSMDALRTILREEGARGLYKGYWATLFSYGPFSAIYFWIFEEAKLALRPSHPAHSQSTVSDLTFSQTLASAALAGSVASLLTNPLDVAKLRFQVQRSSSVSPAHVHYSGLPHALRHLAATQGLRGLFRGALARVLFQAPSTAITMACYEHMARVWAQLLVREL